MSPNPVAAMYARRNAFGSFDFSMLLDVEGSKLLAPGTAEVVKLDLPSEDFNPSTFIVDGSLFIEAVRQRGRTEGSMTYGTWTFERIASQWGGKPEERIITVFARQGAKEKAFGTLENQVWSIDGHAKQQIGEESFRDVVTPAGEHRRLRMVRLQGAGQKWTTDLDGKIMQEGPDGKLVQAGWVGWRKIADPQGKRLYILMAKSLAPGAKWSGHYGGKLYQDK